MSGYRDEERLRQVSARTANAMNLARARLPSIRTRRTARSVAGGLGASLGLILYSVALLTDSWLDRWAVGPGRALFSAQRSAGDDIVSAPAWRPWALVLAVAGCALGWTLVASTGARVARAFDTRLHDVHRRGALEPFLAEELRRLEAQEVMSAGLPLALCAFLAPPSLHAVLIVGIGPAALDGWMNVAATALGAQLVLAVMAMRAALRWRRLGVRALEQDHSWRRSFWAAIPLAMLGGGLRFASTQPLVVDFSQYVVVALAAGAVAACTYLLFWPIAHLAMCRTLVAERLELDELRIALEGLGD